MKFLIVVLSVLVALVASISLRYEEKLGIEDNTAFGYLAKVGQPLAMRIREAELASNSTDETIQQDRVLSAATSSLKIFGGSTARPGDIPYQAGILVTMKDDISLCGGSLLNAKRVLTAAHCWWDGNHKALHFTVVLGSTKLFSGGIRLQTSQVIMHDQWNPIQNINDIAMVYLPTAVEFSNTIRPIALPSGHELNEDFIGQTVFASGFGRTRDVNPISRVQYLSYAKLQVISNAQCARFYRDIPTSNICAVGRKLRSTCRGDSGGPLVITRNNKNTLVGVVAFGILSCETGYPTGFTRVTSYTDWINNHL